MRASSVRIPHSTQKKKEKKGFSRSCQVEVEESAAPDAVLGTLPGVDSEDPALQASLQQSLRDMQVKDSKDQNKQDSK
jgi:hypothetical protein